MDKIEKALEIIHLIQPEHEDYDNFPYKDEIDMDMFLEVVSFMCGHVLSARLKLSRDERNQLMHRLMMELLDNISKEAAKIK